LSNAEGKAIAGHYDLLKLASGQSRHVRLPAEVPHVHDLASPKDSAEDSGEVKGNQDEAIQPATVLTESAKTAQPVTTAEEEHEFLGQKIIPTIVGIVTSLGFSIHSRFPIFYVCSLAARYDLFAGPTKKRNNLSLSFSIQFLDLGWMGTG
jgi:hypothetical protein